jgi:hypothetical protein
VYGRSDKKYCSATCRRDACRVRARIIRLGGQEFTGSEWTDRKRFEVLIAQLEREHGPNHVQVRRAKRAAKRIQEERRERIAEDMARLGL